MSLWRIRHGLSRTTEVALVALVFFAGVFVICLSALQPLVVPVTALIQSIASPVPLDIDAWSLHRNDTERYVYAVPPTWVVADGDPAHLRIARNQAALAAPDAFGTKVTIDVSPVAQGDDVLAAALADFGEMRPAMYDVGVAGQPGVFAIAFNGRRIDKEAVYLRTGDFLIVIRGDGMDPAAFAAFVGAFHFFTP